MAEEIRCAIHLTGMMAPYVLQGVPVLQAAGVVTIEDAEWVLTFTLVKLDSDRSVLKVKHIDRFITKVVIPSAPAAAVDTPIPLPRKKDTPQQEMEKQIKVLKQVPQEQ
jgi:hypothetical protein